MLAAEMWKPNRSFPEENLHKWVRWSQISFLLRCCKEIGTFFCSEPTRTDRQLFISRLRHFHNKAQIRSKVFEGFGKMAQHRRRHHPQNNRTPLQRQIRIKQNISYWCNNRVVKRKNTSYPSELLQYHFISVFVENQVWADL